MQQTQVTPWCSAADEQETADGSSDEDSSSSESDSDLSWRSMSPVTSDDEFSDSPNTESFSGSSDEEELSNILPSGQPPDVPTTAESSSAPTDSSGSQSSGSQGRDNY